MTTQAYSDDTVLADFLEQLFEHGRVAVGPPTESIAGPLFSAARRRLEQYERIVRRDFPGFPPELNLECAGWATVMFYRACQAAVYRELSAEAVAAGLGEPCAAASPASRHYSVDLVFRFLPDLLKLLAGVSPDDPLMAQLRAWAQEWPLSSVGMPDVNTDDLAGIVDHPGMLQHYVDRVIARRDTARMRDPAVQEAMRRSLGGYSHEFPEFKSS